jgi:hypothetical protein
MADRNVGMDGEPARSSASRSGNKGVIRVNPAQPGNKRSEES